MAVGAVYKQYNPMQGKMECERGELSKMWAR